MGVDMHFIEERERKEGYDRGYSNGQQSMAGKIKELSECQKKMKLIKEVFENDESFKALKIKKIVYGEDVE